MLEGPNQPAHVVATAAQPYHRPAIVHELTLETRAGSPLRINPIVDPLGIDPTAH